MSQVLPTSTDAATLKRLQHDCDLVNGQLDALLYSLSHDLRTPAMTALGFTDLLLNDLTGAEPTTRQYLDHVRSGAARQITLIEELAKHLKWLSEPMLIEVLDLSQLCAQVVAELPDHQRHRVSLTVPALNLPGDREMVKRVLSNLLDNALKFTRQSSQPRVDVFIEEQAHTWLVIKDNGVGFHPDHVSRLFKPFRRLHPSREFEGVGMGLATAALLVQRHHGSLTASGDVGMGAEFRFYLDCPG